MTTITFITWCDYITGIQMVVISSSLWNTQFFFILQTIYIELVYKLIRRNKKLHIFKQVSMISQWTMKQNKYYVMFRFHSIFNNNIQGKYGFQIKIQITNVVKVIWKSFWPLLPFLAISYREKWFLRNFICWHLFLVAKNLQTFNETTFNQICVISFWL